MPNYFQKGLSPQHLSHQVIYTYHLCLCVGFCMDFWSHGSWIHSSMLDWHDATSV